MQKEGFTVLFGVGEFYLTHRDFRHIGNHEVGTWILDMDSRLNDHIHIH